jgi:sensor domain CHASE-containing protein
MTANMIPVLWIVWAIFALVTALLYAYRSRLTRDEEGQIFLDEAFAHEKAVQTEIVTKVNRLEPTLRVSIALTVLMTATVIGYYAWFVAKSLFL